METDTGEKNFLKGTIKSEVESYLESAQSVFMHLEECWTNLQPPSSGLKDFSVFRSFFLCGFLPEPPEKLMPTLFSTPDKSPVLRQSKKAPSLETNRTSCFEVRLPTVAPQNSNFTPLMVFVFYSGWRLCRSLIPFWPKWAKSVVCVTDVPWARYSSSAASTAEHADRSRRKFHLSRRHSGRSRSVTRSHTATRY